MDGVTGSTTYRPPGAGARIGSAAATLGATVVLGFCAAFLATVVIGGLTVIVLWVTGHDFHVVAATLTDPVVPDGLPERPPPPEWVASAALVLIVVVTAVATVIAVARFGHGTVGDAVAGIEVRLSDGTRPDRLLVVLRLVIPLAVVALVGWFAAPVWGLLVGAALWLPALAPARRSAVDLVLGLHPVVEVEAKLGRAWGSGTTA